MRIPVILKVSMGHAGEENVRGREGKLSRSQMMVRREALGSKDL